MQKQDDDDAAAHTDRDMYREAMDALGDQLRYLDKFISSEDTVIDLKPFMRPPPEICNPMPLMLPGPCARAPRQVSRGFPVVVRGEVEDFELRLLTCGCVTGRPEERLQTKSTKAPLPSVPSKTSFWSDADDCPLQSKMLV